MSRPALSALVAQMIGWVADAGAVGVPLFGARRNGRVPIGHLELAQARAAVRALGKGAVRPAFHFGVGVAATVGYSQS